MSVVRIHHRGEVLSQNYIQGKSLLAILLDKQIILPAPCGGSGTCGKCKVKVAGEGTVLSCRYYPHNDIDVFLSDRGSAQILSMHRPNKGMALKPNADCSMDNEYGLAIDIGTTSVVFYWVNLQSGGIEDISGIENPQVHYGADVIARINHCTTEAGLLDLQRLIIDAINNNIEKFATKNPEALLHKISVSANACMLHLLIGVNPLPMALAPFVAPFTEAKTLNASRLGLRVQSDATIHILPSASAFVGADIVGGITSLNPPGNIKNYLFLDIGTNGEMAVVTPDKIMSCATAAGPALEGAKISCGMGAFAGAISAFDKSGHQTISNKPAVGICGSGLIDIIAFLIEEKHIESDGNLAENFVLVSAQESGNNEEVFISPQDIREVQLAKSAICTGVKLLLNQANIGFNQLDAVYLAGGFGNYMNPKNAVRIGLIPNDSSVPIIPVGNTSGAAAVLRLLHDGFADKLNETLAKITVVDLLKHPDFELEFAMNMYF